MEQSRVVDRALECIDIVTRKLELGNLKLQSVNEALHSLGHGERLDVETFFSNHARIDPTSRDVVLDEGSLGAERRLDPGERHGLGIAEPGEIPVACG